MTWRLSRPLTPLTPHGWRCLLVLTLTLGLVALTARTVLSWIA